MALVGEEKVVEEWLRVPAAELLEELFLVLVHKVGDHLRVGDDDHHVGHTALRGLRVGDLDTVPVVPP